MTAESKHKGQPMSVMDSLFTVTALQHRMVLATYKAKALGILNTRE